MDFGKILDAWEGANKDAGKTTNDKKSGEKFRASFEAYLNNNPIIDKDKQYDTQPVYDKTEASRRRSRILSQKPDARLDLHNKTKEEALFALENFFNESFENGFEKVLIIHGKGNHSKGEAVLEPVCTEFIEHCKIAGEHGKSKAVDGGSGSTWVILKGSTNRAART
ncbi:DNA mismatch repair protein MutS [Spirochaetia bacterium]|nr:DNA mismatch repair protein MutS [Spirochaetia bacterium]